MSVHSAYYLMAAGIMGGEMIVVVKCREEEVGNMLLRRTRRSSHNNRRPQSYYSTLIIGPGALVSVEPGPMIMYYTTTEYDQCMINVSTLPFLKSRGIAIASLR